LSDTKNARSSAASTENSIAEIESASRFFWPGRLLKRGIRRVLRFVLAPQQGFNHEASTALARMDRQLADQLQRIAALENAAVQIWKLAEQGHYLRAEVARIDAQDTRIEEQIVRSQAEVARIDTQVDRIGVIELGLRQFDSRIQRVDGVEIASEQLRGQLEKTEETLGTSIQNLEEFLPKLMQDITSDFAQLRAVQASLGTQVDEVGGELVANTIDVKRIGKSHDALEADSTSRLQILEKRFEPLVDLDHFDFAKAYRGNEAEIRSRLEKYARNFGDVKRVLDFGCGRGEFLSVCSELDIGAYGVDQDSDMISHCNLQGLEVIEGDALEHLRGLGARSLDGIFSSQVVEHMTPAEIVELIQLASKKLKRGGKIIIETINPNTWSAMRWFYLDPSHSQPVPADMLRFFLHESNFEVLDTLYTSVVPEDRRLALMKIGSPIDESTLTDFLQINNDNVQRLNDVLFGPQDYAIIAER
jgi:SAM-dependent methyltransferase/predicted  nucleic acid-binding Zn-ribbon protein